MKCLVLHLELLMELSWVLLMDPLMVPIMANMWVYCLVIHFDKMMGRELGSPYGDFDSMLVGSTLGV